LLIEIPSGLKGETLQLLKLKIGLNYVVALEQLNFEKSLLFTNYPYCKK